MSPALRRIIDRIWAGRLQLRRLHIDPDLRDVKIVVGSDAWMTILDHKRGEAPIEREYVTADQMTVRVFGIPVEVDHHEFMPNEIRFRSEVTV